MICALQNPSLAQERQRRVTGVGVRITPGASHPDVIAGVSETLSKLGEAIDLAVDAAITKGIGKFIPSGYGGNLGQILGDAVDKAVDTGLFQGMFESVSDILINSSYRTTGVSMWSEIRYQEQKSFLFFKWWGAEQSSYMRVMNPSSGSGVWFFQSPSQLSGSVHAQGVYRDTLHRHLHDFYGNGE